MKTYDLTELRAELRKQLNAHGKAEMHVPFQLHKTLREAARSWAVNKGTEVKCIRRPCTSGECRIEVLYVQEVEVV